MAPPLPAYAARFHRDGYIVVRDVIPAADLDGICQLAERFLASAEEQSKGDPNVGWDRHRVPHPGLDQFADAETAALFRPLLSDTLLQTNRALMMAPEVGMNAAALFKQPALPLGRIFQWHRDGVLRPTAPLPLLGLQHDHQSNATGAVSWNIALEEDASLWLVPGSNRRANTDAEQQALDAGLEWPDEPMPDAVKCELGPGDGVAFDATMMHSGSADADKPRRTFNVSYRAFGGPVLPYGRVATWKPDLVERLPADIALHFTRSTEQLAVEWATIANALKAIIAADASAFIGQLQLLHPGTEGRMACVVQLHRHAHALWTLSRVGPDGPSDQEYQGVTLDHAHNRWRTRQLFDQLTATELEQLELGFAHLDAALRTGPDAAYDELAMPAYYEVEDFVDSWTAAARAADPEPPR